MKKAQNRRSISNDPSTVLKKVLYPGAGICKLNTEKGFLFFFKLLIPSRGQPLKEEQVLHTANCISHIIQNITNQTIPKILEKLILGKARYQNMDHLHAITGVFSTNSSLSYHFMEIQLPPDVTYIILH